MSALHLLVHRVFALQAAFTGGAMALYPVWAHENLMNAAGSFELGNTVYLRALGLLVSSAFPLLHGLAADEILNKRGNAITNALGLVRLLFGLGLAGMIASDVPGSRLAWPFAGLNLGVGLFILSQ